MPQVPHCTSCFVSLNYFKEDLLVQVNRSASSCYLSIHKKVWSGKTLLARTWANVIDVPFSINDATSFTQVLYFTIEGVADS